MVRLGEAVATDGGDGEGMTAAHGSDSAAGARPPVDPFDPVALEARLAAARLRRNSALAVRTAARDARPPAPAGAAAAPPRPIHSLAVRFRGRPATALAGLAAGFCLAVLLGPALPFAARSPEPVAAEPAVVAVAPTVVTTAPATPAAPAAVAAIAPTLADPPPTETASRPEPRPAAHQVPRVTRSARNAPRAPTPPEAVGLMVRDINAATLGRAARALGVRERVAVPGVPLAVTIDRRGLRLHERPVRKRRSRR
jgi:hypothetical protein